jgi:hypothetical protein
MAFLPLGRLPGQLTPLFLEALVRITPETRFPGSVAATGLARGWIGADTAMIRRRWPVPPRVVAADRTNRINLSARKAKSSALRVI